MQEFVFEVLVVFVESLALAHSDEKALGKRSSVASFEILPLSIRLPVTCWCFGMIRTGTVQQCCSALDHLKRIIKHKADSLNKNVKRRIPRYETACLSTSDVFR